MAEVEHLIPCQNVLGEGPLWQPDEAALYWVDIHQKWVERFHPTSGERKTFQFQQALTALGLRAGGGFVVAGKQGFATWDGQGETLEAISDPEADKPNHRFNDGAVGPDGAFWAGSMYEGEGSRQPGSLYRLASNGSFSLIESGLLISNGLGWSPDHKTFYLTDSLRHCIYAYDHNPGSGRLANRRVLVDTQGEAGEPDGLAVDSQGFLWSARWGGWNLTRYDPEGKMERRIELPIEFPTSCTFGGWGLNELYITSAWTPLNKAQRQVQPLAGDLFRLYVDVPGLAEYRYAG